MPVEVRWDEEDPTIIRIDVVGDWTWEEYDASTDILQAMILSVEERVDIIADLRQTGAMPPVDISTSIRYMRRSRDSRPANFGITVNIGGNAFIKEVFKTMDIIDVNKPKTAWVSTLEAARQYITEHRAANDKAST